MNYYDQTKKELEDLLRTFQSAKPYLDERIKKLESDVKKYKDANSKLQKLAEWNLRSTKSALKDVQEILETLEDLYGDEATPKSD